MKILNLKYCIGTLAASLLLAACASDELTDGTVQNLPEGMYPLQIAGVSVTGESTAEPWGANVPQTRIAESTNGNSSVWDGGEEITVQLSGTMADGTSYTAEGQYTLGNDKQTLTPVSGKELYWHSTSAGTVTAWCSPTASNNTVNLSNQSNGLAYVLKAEASNVTYNTSPSLSFSHQLAKVRVALNGDQANKVTDVKIKTLTSCTHTQGTVSGSDATEGWITMKPVIYNNVKYWEANVVPSYAITKFQVNGTDGMLNNNGITPETAKVNTITLTVDKLSLQPANEQFTINAGDDVLIKEYTGTAPIVVNGKATLTLKDVNITLDRPKTAVITVKNGAHLTLNIAGMNNKLTSKDWGGILLNSGASIDIVGQGKEASSLEVKAGSHNDEGASVAGIGAASYVTCGNITIKNVSIKVAGGSAWGVDEGGAAIGTGTRKSACGDICITDSHIEAIGGPGAAAIGLSYTYSAGQKLTVGKINIDNSVIDATIKSYNYRKAYGACIGLSCASGGAVTYTCGTITVKNPASDFLDKLKYEGNGENKGWKIGKGYHDKTTINFSGGTYNGTPFTDGFGSW